MDRVRALPLVILVGNDTPTNYSALDYFETVVSDRSAPDETVFVGWKNTVLSAAAKETVVISYSTNPAVTLSTATAISVAIAQLSAAGYTSVPQPDYTLFS